MSTNTGFAPVLETAYAVAIYEFVGIITSSPTPIPSPLRINSMASVPFAQPIVKTQEDEFVIRLKQDF